MTTFYLVRHGETIWNKEQRLQGWLDSPLTEEGIGNAKKLGKRLDQVDFHSVYSSTSGRAKKTTEYIIGDREIPVLYDEDLREINLGDWQGKQIEDILQKDRLPYKIYSEFPGQFHATHTESFGSVTERAICVLKQIALTYPNETILIVSHGVTIKCIINAVLERGISNLWAPPLIEDTSLSIIEADSDKWRVVEVGNTIHLR
ncbi:MAG: histidine phosphatase family protein [Lysinibacillus sp.]